MNILIYVPQMAEYGGMERHVCSLAIAAAGRKHAVTMITTSNSLGADLRAELNQASVKLRELSRARGSAGALTKAAWLLAHSILLRKDRWDIIYTNGQSALARLPWIAGRAGTRIVHHHHTAADLGEQGTWSPGFRKVLQAASEIVACSRATRDAMAKTLRRQDVRFLPYLTQCPISEAEFKTSLSRKPVSPLRFGFLGRLIPEKGIDAICRLSEDPSLDDIEWHIHGAGAAYPPEHFKKYPRIVYHGAYRGQKQQAAALLSLDALVLFSTHNEGMPLSLLEGLSAGLPIIATDRGGTREIAISGANSSVIAVPCVDADLVRAVWAMADNILVGRTSRTVQRNVYEENFSPEVVSTAWLDYLENKSIPLGRI